jgi:hypothetical protein
MSVFLHDYVFFILQFTRSINSVGSRRIHAVLSVRTPTYLHPVNVCYVQHDLIPPMKARCPNPQKSPSLHYCLQGWVGVTGPPASPQLPDSLFFVRPGTRSCLPTRCMFTVPQPGYWVTSRRCSGTHTYKHTHTHPRPSLTHTPPSITHSLTLLTHIHISHTYTHPHPPLLTHTHSSLIYCTNNMYPSHMNNHIWGGFRLYFLTFAHNMRISNKEFRTESSV